MAEPQRFEIDYVESIDSTNAELLRRPFARARDGTPALNPPHALLAGFQSEGRGRQQRVWHGAPGAAMMLSVAVERRVAGFSPGLSLSLAVCCAEVLEAMGAPAIGLKWPNDLQLGGAKLGGMLIQLRSADAIERTVIGVGINIRLAADLARMVDQPVTALERYLVDPPAPRQLAERLAPALAATCEEHWQEGFAGFRPRWQARDVLVGQPISVLDGGGRSGDAVALGVDQDGYLLAEFADRTERLASAEVSVRRRA